MIKQYKNNLEFLSNNKGYLLQDEIKHSLILGISQKDNDTFTFLSSNIDDRFLLGVLAGKNLILASNTLESDVYLEMINHMDNIYYPGIIGTKEHCEKYNELYIDKYQESLIIKMNQRIYLCSEVNNYSKDLGKIRLADFQDVDILQDWALDFYKDIDPNTTIKDARESVVDKVNRGTLYVLEVNDEIVSMTARARSINKTETIGFVYTPAIYRKKGYASTIVEEITKKIHNDGRVATLYTDLSNPTSNSIYMKIGYTPHCDSLMLNKK
ncbi:hypothetical protein CI105_07315 [Candidatus Izimaplasma bacterium ZiA1]|uniref:GNAT family N-acetyltransferase n=1 Tax=Candidatus Izimoplasma sp. ZiA1 TaxID=2024899 RepID=UPI000BAA8265|nr:hypothetical protein CI105_07315 [Candidatus Izimaplasma bacterium ZiA1]